MPKATRPDDEEEGRKSGLGAYQGQGAGRGSDCMFLVAKAHSQLYKTPLQKLKPESISGCKRPLRSHRGACSGQSEDLGENGKTRRTETSQVKSHLVLTHPLLPPPGPIPPVLGPTVTHPGGAGDRRASASPMQHPQDSALHLPFIWNNPTLPVLSTQVGEAKAEDGSGSPG